MTAPASAALVLALGLGLVPPLHAQTRHGDGVVRGSVVNGADQPIAQAVVELHTRGDPGSIRSAQSNDTGRFQLDSIADGTYYLMIRRIGFGPVNTTGFTVAGGQIRDLGRIRLQESPLQLAPIEVTVERPDVSFEADRTGYLVEALTSAAGGVVTDALRQLPDVLIDIDGSVTLRGNTPAIFINGRPAPMQGVSLQVFLEQFPADRIERIEVLDAPPARYSAEGAGGIINIVLKQGVELGLTGNASFAAGTRNQYTASGRTTLQRGPVNFNGGVDGRWSDSRSSDFTTRQNLLATPVSFLQQDAVTDRSTKNGGLQLDLGYELSKKSRFSAHMGGSLNGNDRDGHTITSNLDELQATTLQYDRHSVVDGSGNSIDGRFGWEYTWKPEVHSFEIQLQAQRNRNGNGTREEIAADSMYLSSGLLPPWLTLRDDASNSAQVSLEADYTHPLGKLGRLELGSNLRRQSNTDDQNTTLFGIPGATLPDQDDSQRIFRVMHVGALYLSLQRRLGKFGFVAGLRGEVVGDQIQFPSLTNLVHRDENHVFPSLSLNWNPRQRLSFRISYGQRINRPSVSIIDPTNRATDPLNRSVGNPDIESSITHNINAGVNLNGKRGQLSIGPYWNRTINGWERVTTVDAAGVSTSTWSNLTTRTNYGASVNWAPPRYKGWTGRLNLSLLTSTLSGSLLPQGTENGKLRWSLGGNLNGPVVRGIIAQGNFGFEPGRDLIQGHTTGQWRADFSFRYRVMNNRTSIGLSVVDPFELRKTTSLIQDPTLIQSTHNRVTTRAMTLNVSYAFGSGKGGPGGPMPAKHD